MERQSDLFQIVASLGASSRFPSHLNRWQEQSDKHTNDGDHDEQFNQGEARSTVRTISKDEMFEGAKKHIYNFLL